MNPQPRPSDRRSEKGGAMRPRHGYGWALIGVLLGIAIAGRAEAQAGRLTEPDVMLLIDTSGSMDWVKRLDGETLGSWDIARTACEDPDDTRLTSWQQLQEVFLGSIDDNFQCAVHFNETRPLFHAISDDIADYVNPNKVWEYQEVGHPHFHSLSCDLANWDGKQCNVMPATTDLHGMRCYDDVSESHVFTADDGSRYCMDWHPNARSRQRNGLLETFEEAIRFGVMSFDNLPKCWGDSCDEPNRENTRWDYGVYRNWDCGTVAGDGTDTCYEWNAGARGGRDQGYSGAVGGLVGIGRTPGETNASVAKVMDSAEPLYCSPLGAMIDDAGFYFAREPNVLPVLPGGPGTDYYYFCRRKLVVLITDGQPTPDFEWEPGACNITLDGLLDWDPTGQAASGEVSPGKPGYDYSPSGDTLLNHNASGPPFDKDANPLSEHDYPQKDIVFPCPWRSSPEEAGELFKAGQDILEATTYADHRLAQPIYLVVVGFNVPDVNCDADPESCYPYTDAYNNDRCWVAACAASNTCYMSPRDLVNEIACKGWPWNPAAGTESTDTEPFWLEEYHDGTNPNLCTINVADQDDFLCVDYGARIDRALFTNSTSNLKSVLNMVLSQSVSKAVTRTDVVTWNIPNPGTTQQCEFRSGFVEASLSKAPSGVLTRQDYECGDDGVEKGPLYDVGAKIKAQGGARDIRTTVKPPTSFSYIDPQATASDVTDWVNNTLDTTKLDDLTECDFCRADQALCDASCTTRTCGVNTTMCGYIVEETKKRGLAEIRNSTPAVLGAPQGGNRPSFFDYQLEHQARHPYLFVGSSDGVLHAIDIKKIDDDSATKVESWGFVPRSVLKDLQDLYPRPVVKATLDVDPSRTTGIWGRGFLLDGPPVAQDVLLLRLALGFDPAIEAAAWRAVVFGGVGKNNRAYYALDVTDSLKDPANLTAPEVRWEISPADGLWANNDPPPASDPKEENWPGIALSRLGAPVSRPTLAYVKDVIGSAPETEVAVAAAIVPGGWKSDTNPNGIGELSGNTGIYIVRLGDGQVLKYLEPTYPTATGLDGKTTLCSGCIGLDYDTSTSKFTEGAQLIGQPVVPYGTLDLRVATEAFIGDDRGRLWRIDLSEPDPTDWTLELYFDSLLAWDYPYKDCVDPGCTPGGLHVDSCTGDASGLPCDTSNTLLRNMEAPRYMLLGAPAVAKDEDNKLVMVFGTGQYDDLAGWTRNRIFSISHELHPDGSYNREINWWIGDPLVSNDFGEVNDTTKGSWLGATATEMESRYLDYANYNGGDGIPKKFWNVGEKLISRPVIFDGVTYFTTFVPLSDPDDPGAACDDGGSRIWALDFNGKVDTGKIDITNGPAEQMFDGEYFGWFLNAASKHVMFKDYPDMVLSGTSVVQRPSCDSNEDSFKIVAQRTELAELETHAGESNPPEPIDVVEESIVKNNNLSFIQVRFDSWSIVF